MKRELRFRAWNESAKRYSKPFGLKNDVLNFTDDDGIGIIKSLANEVIEQLTGLKDKNGKEIYEGDKIDYICAKDDRLSGVIVFENYAWGIRWDYDNKLDFLWDYSCELHTLEVTGTIHD